MPDETITSPIPDDESTVSPPRDLMPSGERAGDRIGPYRLLEKIGEGGFGIVFVAEQVEPVRRRVALKGHQARHG
jgi:hypothetical protein